jgi:PhzF family phenazine biosynthesis protein
MKTIECLQIDAFTDRAFAGNPAAVCLLDESRDDDWMQSVAAEMNLSETAFVVPQDDAFELRWFTPLIEIDLCGHGTLASAHALWSKGLASGDEPIHFDTKSGRLTCTRQGDLIEMDFPATPPEETEPPEELIEALGIAPSFVGRSRHDKLVVVESEGIVRALEPDFSRLGKIPGRGIIVTARATESPFDFVSRFFAPATGMDEDPVTGSAHCCTGPWWIERLGKKRMTAFQASRRGGVVHVTVGDDRVVLGGRAVTVLEGRLTESASR